MNLKQLIHDKINEIFLEYQKAHHILNGDITPFDAERLVRIETALCTLIEDVARYQQRKQVDPNDISWYIYTDAEGIAHSETFSGIDMDKFLYKVSQRIAFDDCSGETVQKIYFKGKELKYVGWQPGMKYEYTDLDGNTVWVGQFEEWDH